MSDAFGFDPGLNARWRGAVDAHKDHARADWPAEAVGLVDAEGGYHPCENIAEDPTSFFEIRDRDLAAVDGGRPAALLHSHTAVPHPESGATTQPNDSPSAADMQTQIDMAIPWGISLCIETGATDPFWFGDQVPRPPLFGRSFRHGVDDCYAFIRDWHREVAGIAIPDFPRDAEWWEPREDAPQQDLYRDGFEAAGFDRVHRPDGPLPGDVFLCSIRSPVMNHGGVYLGDGLIGHHLVHQLSLRSPATIWRAKLGFLVRHRDLPDDWRPDHVRDHSADP
ncbi:NlpC/P60 family protein [Methylobacterium gnaphalii]|uniref:Peptidase P60 n=1 Tax=Methylobacterium gnaphalii TaxID=1010610 RepID=A0A512JMB8_9HYPH|nr:NlpC/P60 family protein [Methylobacterium gnaphalii]GEP11115.1 peptidase P60 [Methylobacterium gnaphalii]GJD69905.1 hypothetical protein MMMDOFMJ_2844 [Methylobacterium gnaphalii]GLS50393.1 peptidase P60 [Methylobacterium gnaphalii]